MYELDVSLLSLTEAETAFLRLIEQQMGIVADFSRADILLYSLKSNNEIVVLGHAQPHSIDSIYYQNRKGYVISNEQMPEIRRIFISGKQQKNRRNYNPEEGQVITQILPVYFPAPFSVHPEEEQGQEKHRVVAALTIVTHLIQYERHQLSSPVFQQALKKLQRMLLYGRLVGAENLTAFGDQDGIIFVDKVGIIRYTNGIATKLYRKLGYKEILIGRHLSDFETVDEELRRAALEQNRCLEWETKESDRFWIRKVLPLMTYSSSYWNWLKIPHFVWPVHEKLYGALITLHEVMKIRHQDQKILIKSSYNPYISGPPVIDPNLFFGRQSDLEKIINLLARNFIMLIGPRRIGKTSLLHQLAYHLPRLEDLPEQFVPILVNVEGIPEIEFFHTVMEEIVATIQKYLPTETMIGLAFDLSIPTYSSRAFSRDLQTLLKSLQSTMPRPTRLVLLLDEMDTLNSYSLETQSQLRRIFQRFTNHNLSVVVAGVRLQQQWAGESSPFYNMFVPVALTPFPGVEIRRLITEPVEGVYSYSDESINRILEVTSGLPHRVQQLCLEIIHHLQATTEARTEITLEDVNTVLPTIHWLDEEVAAQDEVITPPITKPAAIMAEKRASYPTADSTPSDQDSGNA